MPARRMLSFYAARYSSVSLPFGMQIYEELDIFLLPFDSMLVQGSNLLFFETSEHRGSISLPF